MKKGFRLYLEFIHNPKIEITLHDNTFMRDKHNSTI
jgi:hypothetical protein